MNLSLFGFTFRMELARDQSSSISSKAAARVAQSVFNQTACDLNLPFASSRVQTVWSLARALIEASVLARSQGETLFDDNIANWDPIARALGSYKAQRGPLKQAAAFAQNNDLLHPNSIYWGAARETLFEYPFARFKSDLDLAWAVYERDTLSSSASPASLSLRVPSRL